ncbi:MAG: FliM/FliN family flagellar motor switch protein [Terracidiphilus sp.]|jgi:flagellar motor switch protein FliN
MKSFLECWTEVATALFSQALAGEPELVESLPKPMAPGAFGFAAVISGDQEGRFAVLLDGALLETPLVGEGINQRAGWAELLREVMDAACGELLAKTGKTCRVASFAEVEGESKLSRAFQLKSGERSWTVLVRDEVRAPKPAAAPAATQPAAQPASQQPAEQAARAAASGQNSTGENSPGWSAGVELLLDVELEATLRFGCKEMLLADILDLGPGDVVQLDRNVADPVDLIVGDKIVARGEVVLINGNFGLRVTEVAMPRKRLESIRCLF